MSDNTQSMTGYRQSSSVSVLQLIKARVYMLSVQGRRGLKISVQARYTLQA